MNDGLYSQRRLTQRASDALQAAFSDRRESFASANRALIGRNPTPRLTCDNRHRSRVPALLRQMLRLGLAAGLYRIPRDALQPISPPNRGLSGPFHAK